MSPQAAQSIAAATAALSALVIVLKYLHGKSGPYSAFVRDPAKAAKRVSSEEDEYDFNEYDVVVVGGGACLAWCGRRTRTNRLSVAFGCMQGLLDVYSHHVCPRILQYACCCSKRVQGMPLSKRRREQFYEYITAHLCKTESV